MNAGLTTLASNKELEQQAVKLADDEHNEVDNTNKLNATIYTMTRCIFRYRLANICKARTSYRQKHTLRFSGLL